MTRGAPQRPLNCASAFLQIARAALRDVERAHPAASRGDADGIHRMRIGITRLAAARKFFAAMVTDDAWPTIRMEIAWLNRILGEARDNDVALALAGEMPVPIRGLDRKIRSSHTRAARALASKRYHSLLATLRTWIDRGPWTASSDAAQSDLRRTPLDAFAAKRLAKWSRRLARYDHSVKGGQQHRARILAKRYRYMVEALDRLGIDISRSERRKAKAARRLQRALGDVRDLHRVRQDIGAGRRGRLKNHEDTLLRRARKAFDKFT